MSQSRYFMEGLQWTQVLVKEKFYNHDVVYNKTDANLWKVIEILLRRPAVTSFSIDAASTIHSPERWTCIWVSNASLKRLEQEPGFQQMLTDKEAVVNKVEAYKSR